MKLKFTRLQAAHAFASMAEGMAEVQRDDDTFLADQYSVLAQNIWDNLEQVDSRFVVDVPNGRDICEAVRDNCEDNAEDDDDCHMGECIIDGDPATMTAAAALGIALQAVDAMLLTAGSADAKAQIEQAALKLRAMLDQQGCGHFDAAGDGSLTALIDIIIDG